MSSQTTQDITQLVGGVGDDSLPPKKKLCKRDFFSSPLLFFTGQFEDDNTTPHTNEKREDEEEQRSKLNQEKKRVSLLLPVLLDGRASTDSAGWETQEKPLAQEISLRTGNKKEPSSITRQKKKRLNASAGRVSSFFLPFCYQKHHHHPGFIWKKKGQPKRQERMFNARTQPNIFGISSTRYLCYSFIHSGRLRLPQTKKKNIAKPRQFRTRPMSITSNPRQKKIYFWKTISIKSEKGNET